MQLCRNETRHNIRDISLQYTPQCHYPTLRVHCHCSPRVVVTHQGVQSCHADEVDVVTDDHQVSHVVRSVDRPGGISQYQGVDPEELEDANREGDLGRKRKHSV